MRRIALGGLGFAIVLCIWEIAGQYLGSALFAPPSAVAV